VSDQFFWFVTRSAALVAWLCAALAILVGLATSSRWLGRRPTIPWLVDFHRMLAALSVIFLAIHMISLWLDSFVQFGPVELLVPWVATVPGLTRSSLAYGVIAAWLLAAVQISSLLKDRMPGNVWHTIHLLSFGSLIIGTIHAIQTGSDVDNPLVVGIGVSVLTAIVLSTVVRLVRIRADNVEPIPDDLFSETELSEPEFTDTRFTNTGFTDTGLGQGPSGAATARPAGTRPPEHRRPPQP
jgi:predicted ferric reductase